MDRGSRYFFSETTSFDSSNIIKSALDLSQNLPVYLSDTGPDPVRLRQKWEMYLEASDLASRELGFTTLQSFIALTGGPGWTFLSNHTQNSACGL